MELIDRNELLKAMNTFEPIVDGPHDTFGMLEHAQWEYGCAMVRNAPAVDTYTEQDVRDAYTDGYSTGMEQGMEKSVVHGRWIVEENGGFRNVRCSVCGKDYACHYGMLQLQNFRYCPECGARMEG